MKKILIGFTLIMSFTALAQSKNYESKLVNDDGTVSIVKPKFSDPTGSGKKLPVSAYSKLDGVCKLYGLGPYVEKSLISYDSYYSPDKSSKYALISAEGRFRGFDIFRRIGSLACQGQTIPSSSQNYLKLSINDDGTTTLLMPRFKMHGTNYVINVDSDLDGVCKLYGFKAYVASSLVDFVHMPYDFGRSVVISQESIFEAFKIKRDVLAIKSIVCE